MSQEDNTTGGDEFYNHKKWWGGVTHNILKRFEQALVEVSKK